MERHDITMSDIEGEVVETHRFKCKKEDHELVKQVIANTVDPSGGFWENNVMKNKAVGFKCTQAERLEIEYKIEIYLRDYKKRIREILFSFCNQEQIIQ